MLKTSSSERTLLKNLGAFLGRLTVARNRPVLQKDLDVKSTILGAYEAGRMTAVLPFVRLLLEPCMDSKVRADGAGHAVLHEGRDEGTPAGTRWAALDPPDGPVGELRAVLLGPTPPHAVDACACRCSSPPTPGSWASCPCWWRSTTRMG